METTPLARHSGHGLLESLASGNSFGLGARLVARLIEMARLPDRMLNVVEALHEAQTTARISSPSGVGIAQVEAARGRLVHAVEVAQGRIAGYRILAPTEWNFHPGGAAAKALSLIAGSAHPALHKVAEIIIAAFDPCVDYDLAVR